MNLELLDGLIEAIRGARGARALVLCGAGRAFCVGADLHETLAPRTGSAEELREALEHLQEITRALTGFQGP